MMGGKPSKGTKKDKRLKRNSRKQKIIARKRALKNNPPPSGQ